MDPRDKLREAKVAVSQGRYADALQAHIWFHDHALEHEPSLYGVRLSFALADWAELGSAYPEALRSLGRTRDSKAAALIAGSRSRDCFHDVMAINRELGVSGRTYELFRRLCEIDADFARSCASIAMDAIVEAKDFRLAESFLADPVARVRAWSQQLNTDVRRLRDPGLATHNLDRKLAGHARVYAEAVGGVLAVLDGVGRADEARAARAAAIDSVEDEVVRCSVRDLLPRYGDAG